MNATRLALCTLIAAATLCEPARAGTWTGAGADNKWTTPENWYQNSVPPWWADAEFPATAAQFEIQTVGGSPMVRDLIFQPGASGYDIDTALRIGRDLIMHGGTGAVNKVSGGIAMTNDGHRTEVQVIVYGGQLDLRDVEMHALGLEPYGITFMTFSGAELNLPRLTGASVPGRLWLFYGDGLFRCEDKAHSSDDPIRLFDQVTVVVGWACRFEGTGAWKGYSQATLVFESTSMTGGPLDVAGTLWMRRGSGMPVNTEVPSLTLQPGAVFRFEVAADGTHNALSTGTTPNQLGGAELQVWNFDAGSGHSYSVLRGAVPVNGTFAGLPEGAVFTDASGRGYSITYHGGASGMDVVITEAGLFKDGFE